MTISKLKSVLSHPIFHGGESPTLQQVQYCIDTPVRRGQSSYHLKHVAEQSCKVWLPEAAMIAAIMLRDIPFRIEGSSVVATGSDCAGSR